MTLPNPTYTKYWGSNASTGNNFLSPQAWDHIRSSPNGTWICSNSGMGIYKYGESGDGTRTTPGKIYTNISNYPRIVTATVESQASSGLTNHALAEAVIDPEPRDQYYTNFNEYTSASDPPDDPNNTTNDWTILEDANSATSEHKINEIGTAYYELPVTVKGVSTSLTDYQVKIEITDTTVLSHMSADLSELRVYATSQSDPYNSGDVEVPHWVEFKDAAKAIVWVKMDIAANATKTIYLYYGPANAVNTQQPEKVFDLFDGFDGTTLDTGEWTAGGSSDYAVSGGTLQLNEGCSMTGSTTVGSGHMVEYKVKYNNAGNRIHHDLVATPSGYKASLFMRGSGDAEHTFNTNTGSWGTEEHLGVTITTGTYYVARITHDANNKWFGALYNTDYTLNGTESSKRTVTSQSAYAHMSNVDYNGATVATYDWVRMRKHSIEEPQVLVRTASTTFYELPVTISSTGKLWSDYQIRFKITNTTILSHIGNGGDLRIFDTQQSDPYDSTGNPIPFWIEYSSSSRMDIWVRMDLPASGDKTIYLYYGSNDGFEYSDPEGVFEFYDGFEGTSLDTTKWNTSSLSYTMNGDGTLQHSSGSMWTKSTFGPDMLVEYKQKWSSYSYRSYSSYRAATDGDYATLFNKSTGYITWNIYENGSWGNEQSAGSYGTNTYYILGQYNRSDTTSGSEIAWGGTTSAFPVGSVNTPAGTFMINEAAEARISGSGGVTTTFDWVRVRKYSYSTHFWTATLGTEGTVTASGESTTTVTDKQLHFFSDRLIGDEYSVLEWNKTGNIADVDVYSRFRFGSENPDGTGNLYGVGARVDTAEELGTVYAGGYYLLGRYYPGNNTIYFHVASVSRSSGGVGGRETSLGSFSLTYDGTRVINVRLRAEGTTIKAKAWFGDDDTAQPTTWNVSATDSTFSTGGVAIVAGGHSTSSSPANSAEYFKFGVGGNGQNPAYQPVGGGVTYADTVVATTGQYGADLSNSLISKDTLTFIVNPGERYTVRAHNNNISQILDVREWTEIEFTEVFSTVSTAVTTSTTITKSRLQEYSNAIRRIPYVNDGLDPHAVDAALDTWYGGNRPVEIIFPSVQVGSALGAGSVTMKMDSASPQVISTVSVGSSTSLTRPMSVFKSQNLAWMLASTGEAALSPDVNSTGLIFFIPVYTSKTFAYGETNIGDDLRALDAAPQNGHDGPPANYTGAALTTATSYSNTSGRWQFLLLTFELAAGASVNLSRGSDSMVVGRIAQSNNKARAAVFLPIPVGDSIAVTKSGTVTDISAYRWQLDD